MYIKKLSLKNFRCFTDRQFDIDGQFVLIQGKNGIGKTSFLEALHYGCHLRSFRTPQPNDLINFDSKYFFISINIESQNQENNTINIGYSAAEGKQVKINTVPIQTYKELTQQMRIITLTADDIQLVSGYPEKRRMFLNQSIVLEDSGYIGISKKYQTILEQRNQKLLTLKKTNRPCDDELMIWTESLWLECIRIQNKCIAMLLFLEQQVNTLLSTYFIMSEQNLSISLTYSSKHVSTTQNFTTFRDLYKNSLVSTELSSGRSVFGVHLDDFIITFKKQRARVFASRGQQKLVVFLLKIAQMQIVIKHGSGAILLLDDFLTDFDHDRIQECFALLSAMPFQILITNPGLLGLNDSMLPPIKSCIVNL